MELGFLAIDYRDPAWIAFAFMCGLLVKQLRLPPMVGFLVAGFVLHAFGAESGTFLEEIADLGVTLLLFTIGLKLRITTLIRPEIWATTAVNMVAMTAVALALVFALGLAGMSLFADLDVSAALVVAFALSFSSTVFAVKTLEDRSAVVSRYGRIAIGILVIQDIAAVVFLAASADKLPSIWALGLLALIPARHLLGFLLTHTGHKELLSVFGFAAALGGAALFEAVGMKGDLGALVLGVLLAQHARADELSKTMMGFKDVFLVCFFLTIGLTGLPTWETVGAALALLILLPVKTGLFLLLLTRFRLRARASVLTSAILGNFSEFGLIVAAIAIGTDLLPQEWLTVLALAVSVSFLVSSPMNLFADDIYLRWRKRLKHLEIERRLPGDEDIELSGSRILIFGMGRVGRAAYDQMEPHVTGKILGIDQDEAEVERNEEAGRRVVQGDATNPEFWSRLPYGALGIEMILLALPDRSANIAASGQLREHGYGGPIVATALYPEDEASLKENGVDAVFNVYAEAGAGAASHMWEAMNPKAE